MGDFLGYVFFAMIIAKEVFLYYLYEWWWLWLFLVSFFICEVVVCKIQSRRFSFLTLIKKLIKCVYNIIRIIANVISSIFDYLTSWHH